jgi:protein TonB
VRLRGHLDGRVVLDVATDGSGRVTSAGIARSSGDRVLDAHALATVQRWRFAVPSGSPGVQGELPMRFDSSAHATPR